MPTSSAGEKQVRFSRQSSSDTQRFSEAEGTLNPYSPKREAFIKKSRAGLGCKRQALSDLRSAALGQNIERLAGKKCRVTNPIDKSLVGALMAIPPQQRTDEDKRKITQIFEENDKFNQCHFSVEIDWLN